MGTQITAIRLDQSSFPGRTKDFTGGMDFPPSRFSSLPQSNKPGTESASMSTMALRAHVLSAPRDMWEERRTLELPSGPNLQTDRIELPPIRQVFPSFPFSSLFGLQNLEALPEIELRGNREDADITSYSPTSQPGTMTRPLEYIQSSPSLNKRRRLSTEDEPEPLEHIIPRLYDSPTRPTPRSQSVAISPTSTARRARTLSTATSFAGSNGASPYIEPRGLPTVRSSPPVESTSIARSEWKPTLPTLPSLYFDPSMPRGRSTFSEYSLDSPHSGAQTYPQLSNSVFDPPVPPYHPPGSSYGYQQPRGQSYPGPSSHDRTPFSASSHHSPYPGSSFSYGIEMGEGANDSRQRKRRGNLPKETTDKLRAWFVAHLQHPYPTEDEKQELMRQTGLQISILFLFCSI